MRIRGGKISISFVFLFSAVLLPAQSNRQLDEVLSLYGVESQVSQISGQIEDELKSYNYGWDVETMQILKDVLPRASVRETFYREAQVEIWRRVWSGFGARLARECLGPKPRQHLEFARTSDGQWLQKAVLNSVVRALRDAGDRTGRLIDEQLQESVF